MRTLKSPFVAFKSACGCCKCVECRCTDCRCCKCGGCACGTNDYGV